MKCRMWIIGIPTLMLVMVWGNWANAQWYVTDKVQNGDFALDPLANGWVASGSYIYPSDGNPGPGVTLYQPDGRLNYNIVGLTPGVEYKVAADTDFFGDVARNGDVKVWVNVYDSAGTLLNGVSRDGGNGWIRLENVFTAPADGKVRIELTGQTYTWEAQAYWDNVVLYSSVPYTPEEPVWYRTNRIKNGSFSVDPLTNGWVHESGNYTWPNIGVSGYGVTLSKIWEDDPDALLSQTITELTADLSYKVAAETDFFGDVARNGDVHVWLNVYDSAGAIIGQAQRNGGNGWITLEVEFTAPADGVVRVQITGQNYYWEAEAYWDNVILYSSVEEEEPIDPNAGKIQNGDFTVGITGWNYWGTDGASTYVFGAFDESTTQWTAPANIGLSGSAYWDENFGNPEPCATVYHNAVWGTLGVYQVVPVVPGTEYTIDAQWKSATGMTSSSCYAEFIVYDATAVEVDDIRTVLVNSCSNWPQNSIVAKKDTFSNLNSGNLPWDWQSITTSMGGGFDHTKGTNKITPANPYLVLVFKFGGTYGSSVSFQIDNVTLSTQADRIPGDANGDGMVDVGDLGILAANYGGSGKTWEQGDFNGDGLVDVGDLGILAANYGTNASNADWSSDYAKAFGTMVDDGADEETTGSVCSALGLPLIAGLALMGLMLVKLEE